MTQTQYVCTLFDRKNEVTEALSHESLISLKQINDNVVRSVDEFINFYMSEDALRKRHIELHSL